MARLSARGKRLLRWSGHRVVAAVSRTFTWWREALVFILPFAVLGVFALSPEIWALPQLDPAIGTIATIQGAVTGLSLIALVLAVELAGRQEDRDDIIYEIMLHAAWIRPAFALAVAALLATMAAMALSTFATSAPASNLLLCSYVLTAMVALSLMAAVWRTMHVLRPTGIVEHRFRANERERRRRVLEYLANDRHDRPDAGDSDVEVHAARAVSLIATDRLFVEVEDALQGHQAGPLRWALDRLRLLIEASSNQIAAANLTRGAVLFRYGVWFPLDVIEERLYEFWRAASGMPHEAHVRELWRFQSWLVTTGVERRQFELVELVHRPASFLMALQRPQPAHQRPGNEREPDSVPPADSRAHPDSSSLLVP